MKVKGWVISFKAELEDGTEISRLFMSSRVSKKETIDEALRYIEKMRSSMIMVEDDNNA